MTVLAIDSASEVMSVALQSESGFAETTIVAGPRASEYLMPTVDALVALARCPRRFDLLVCMKGPGSFTGLRIGMATAKGLAAGSGGSLVTIPTLEAISYGLSHFDGVVVPAIDARKHRFYTALFRGGERLTEDMDLSAEAIAAALQGKERVLFTGPAATLLTTRLQELDGGATAGSTVDPPRETPSRPMHGFRADPLRHGGWIVDPHARRGWAANLVTLGVERFLRSGGEPDDAGPVYLRPSEAELTATGGERNG